MNRILPLSLLAASILSGQPYTRGIGVYPGDPSQDFAPTLVPDATTYRNLALHRPAYQSSAYDYNLTAQLVTDGIKDTKLPRWISVSTSQARLAKQEREWLVDNNPLTGPDLKGPRAWVSIEIGGGDTPIEVDRVDVDARARNRAAWKCVLSGSGDGQSWKELGRADGANRPGGQSVPSVTSMALASPS